MFRISTQDQAGPVGMFGDGLAHFHAVTRSLATHWYHVSLMRRHEDRFVAYEEMLNDEMRLVELLVAQDESLVVQEVQAVTPSWMNKDGSWKMEKLTSLSIGHNQAGVAVCVMEVEGGAVYVDTHEPGLGADSLNDVKELYRRGMAEAGAAAEPRRA